MSFIFVCTANPDTDTYVGLHSWKEYIASIKFAVGCVNREDSVVTRCSGWKPHLHLSSKIRVLSHVLRNKSSLFGRQKLHPLPSFILYPSLATTFTLPAISSCPFFLLFLSRARLPSRSSSKGEKEMVTNHPSSVPLLAIFSLTPHPPQPHSFLLNLTRIPEEVTFFN